MQNATPANPKHQRPCNLTTPWRLAWQAAPKSLSSCRCRPAPSACHSCALTHTHTRANITHTQNHHFTSLIPKVRLTSAHITSSAKERHILFSICWVGPRRTRHWCDAANMRRFDIHRVSSAATVWMSSSLSSPKMEHVEVVVTFRTICVVLMLTKWL